MEKQDKLQAHRVPGEEPSPWDVLKSSSISSPGQDRERAEGMGHLGSPEFSSDTAVSLLEATSANCVDMWKGPFILRD